MNVFATASGTQRCRNNGLSSSVTASTYHRHLHHTPQPFHCLGGGMYNHTGFSLKRDGEKFVFFVSVSPRQLPLRFQSTAVIRLRCSRRVRPLSSTPPLFRSRPAELTKAGSIALPPVQYRQFATSDTAKRR